MNNPLIGRGWVFPLTLDQRGTFALTSDHDELAQAIQIILSTAPGQRVMRPDFGCRIHELVFAPNDGATAGLAINYVTDALGQWEPRITLTNVEADPDPENANVLQITVNYQ